MSRIISRLLVLFTVFLFLTCNNGPSLKDELDDTFVDYTATELIVSSTSTKSETEVTGTLRVLNEGNVKGNAFGWEIMVSQDESIDAGDTTIDVRTAQGIGKNEQRDIDFSGNWPGEAGDYYLIAQITYEDDSDSENNSFVSDLYNIRSLDIDYTIGEITGITVTSSDGINVPFSLMNSGEDDGSDQITWKAYLSPDESLETEGPGSDLLIDSATEEALTAEGSAEIYINTGTWPAVSSESIYYIIITLDSRDDIDSGNDIVVSTAFTVQPLDVEYSVSEILGAVVNSGSPVEVTLTIENSGTDSGSSPVNWFAYISTDNVYGGDYLVDEGTFPALTSGTDISITIDSGTWPVVTGSSETRYLIIRIDAADNRNTQSSFSSQAFTIQPRNIDYEFSALPPGGTANIASAIDEQFSVRNNGTDDGTASISWNAYISNNSSYEEGTDILIDSGSIAGGIAAGETAVDTISGIWGMETGTRYIILTLSASDESDSGTGDNTAASAAYELVLPDVLYTAGGLTGGSVDSGTEVNETFFIENSGQNDGTEQVEWFAYVSTDETYGSGDYLIDDGTISALSSGSSANITIDEGVWPEITGSAENRYLIIRLLATDNENAVTSFSSGVFEIQPPDIDYEFSIVPSGSTANIGSAISEQITIRNIGSDDGSAPVTWNAYISEDNTYDGATDSLIDSGTIIGGIPAGGSRQETITGTWGTVEGSRYLIFTLSAVDELDSGAGNNTGLSGEYTLELPDVTYTVGVIPGRTVGNSAPVTESFTIENTGVDNGSYELSWFAYVSRDQSFGGDYLVDEGTITALASGAEESVTIDNGSWPGVTGSEETRYLIIRLDAVDNRNSQTSFSSSAFTVEPRNIDYLFSAVPSGSTENIGSAISEQITIRNNGTDNGTSPVTWNAYISEDESYDEGSDILFDSGTIVGGLTAGGSIQATITGAWGTTAGTRYLIFTLSADDELDSGAGNNTEYSGEYTLVLPAVDYSVQNLTPGTDAGSGENISASFQISNQGSEAGVHTINWTAYLSGDNVLDSEDTEIDAGSRASLASGTSVQISIDDGQWPEVLTEETRYLIVEIEADDDTITANNSAQSLFTILPYDVHYTAGFAPGTVYTVGSGEMVSLDFSIENTGTDSGRFPVSWTAYLSDDNTLDGSDTQIDTGSIGALTAGSDASASIDAGEWDTFLAESGQQYIILSIEADDNQNTDTEFPSSVFTVEPLDIDYTISTIPGVTVNSGEAVSASFTVTNSGSDNAAAPITWNAYISPDDNIDGSYGASIDSGTITAEQMADDVEMITIDNGLWPVLTLDSEDRYLIITLTTTDDTDTGNNTRPSTAFTVQPLDIDYTAASFNAPGGAVDNGDALSISFSVENSGTDDDPGSVDSVEWELYASLDGTLNTGTDTLIASGTIDPLAAGTESVPVSPSYIWNLAEGSWYLFVRIISDADTDPSPASNTARSAAFYTVTDPEIDFSITAAPAGSPVFTNRDFTAEFTVTNSGEQAAAAAWTAYLSTDAVYNQGVDPEIDSGTTSTIADGASTAVEVNGSWGDTAGTRFIVLLLADDDDNSNNEASSSAYTVTIPDINYIVSTVPEGDGASTIYVGDAVADEFIITNTGADDAAEDLTWTAYASLNSSYEAGDILLNSGTISGGLSGGANTGNISVGGTWPSVAEDYFIVIVLESAEDPDSIEDNTYASSADYTVNAYPDYSVTAESFDLLSLGGNTGEAVTSAGVVNQFRIQNTGASPGPGGTPGWTVSLSADQVPGPGDYTLDSGALTAVLANGATSGAINITGSLPLTAGAYYIIVEIEDTDDSDVSDNVWVSSTPVYIWSAAGNVESDQTDDTTATADDFYAVLNSGDSITISGTIDSLIGYSDLFSFRTGPGVTSVQILITWETGTNALDMILYDGETPVSTSRASVANAEPAAGTYVWSGLEQGEQYYIAPEAQRNDEGGETYTLTITAP